MKRILSTFLLVIFIGLVTSQHIFAQENQATQTTEQSSAVERTVSLTLRATEENAAMSGQNKIILWGTSLTGSADTELKIRARDFLDKALGNDRAECTVKSRTTDAFIAQCRNAAGTDLGLLMIQSGYVIADRSAIIGTADETRYLDAEKTAQQTRAGVWVQKDNAAQTSNNSNLLLTLGFVLFIVVVIAFILLTFVIMQGFHRVIDAQNRHNDFAIKERALKDKERHIFANMLDAEIKANKSKIEAYIIVYEEMLKSLQDPSKPPKYKTAGDIIQMQPALIRSVFDRNTDKLDVLGNELSSAVIHFYARIKSKADYTNIEPDMPLPEVTKILEKVMSNAKRLNTISDNLIDSFAQSSISSSEKTQP